jgi:monooxygenase
VSSEYFDVVIVGAGLSGIGAACHLREECPGKSLAILESRENIGGTWDLFRYPGIRSDSDMHTLGYIFKPWKESRAIARGPAILSYIRETATEYDVEKYIRFGQKVVRATWSSEDAAWLIETRDKASDAVRNYRCNMILMCAGYYNYEHGYLPEFRGRDRFHGTVVHPQDWPEDLDYSGQRVVVIGSGATAMTLVPEMAKDAAHVAMLQRSPTYVISFPDKDLIANILRSVLPGKWAYAITRWKNIGLQQWIYRQSRIRPDRVKRLLLHRVRKELGADYPVEKHFTPSYDPWDQRLCLVPNSDLFESIRSGKASVVTDTIDTFTEKGIRLDSGDELEADVVVTATGLDLLVLGGVEFVVDGDTVDFAERMTYKGLMISGVPNLVSTFGYINASWTLRADLIAEWFCRLVNYLDAIGAQQVTPTPGPDDKPVDPYITGFSSGYIQRVLDRLPRQSGRGPWLNPQDYRKDRKLFREAPIDDGALTFRRHDRPCD